MRWLIRLLSRLGLRWLVIGVVARFVARKFGRRTVERAADELEAKANQVLPAPVARAVSALPVEVRHVGGSALVAGRAARTAVNTSRRAGRFATSTSRRVVSGVGAARAAVRTVKEETDASTRQLRARYLEATVSREAATNSMLSTRALDSRSLDDPHDLVPGPVPAGRMRSRRRPSQVVHRIRRSYRPTPKAWE